MKQRMARCKKDGSDWQQALQELRSTPTKDLPSPAEILHGRPARTVNGQAPANPVNMDEIKQNLEQKQEQYAQNYNCRHRVTPLAPLHLQNAPATAAPRRSRRKRTKVCYQPFKQRTKKK